ncbi:MAG: hypothetical protein ACTSXJ_00140 [Candidatus Baldrarchaeia archaeon]
MSGEVEYSVKAIRTVMREYQERLIEILRKYGVSSIREFREMVMRGKVRGESAQDDLIEAISIGRTINILRGMLERARK